MILQNRQLDINQKAEGKRAKRQEGKGERAGKERKKGKGERERERERERKKALRRPDDSGARDAL
jgi:hypothetical protein